MGFKDVGVLQSHSVRLRNWTTVAHFLSVVKPQLVSISLLGPRLKNLRFSLDVPDYL